MKRESKRCPMQGVNAFQTHFSGGKSVEYNSTFVSASKSARIPRAQILLSQYLHSSLMTVLVWNAGCILRDITLGKPPLSLSFQSKTFPPQRRHKNGRSLKNMVLLLANTVFWLVVAWWRSRLTWPLNFLKADWAIWLSKKWQNFCSKSLCFLWHHFNCSIHSKDYWFYVGRKKSFLNLKQKTVVLKKKTSSSGPL